MVLEKRIPWTAKRSNQSILKEIHSEYSLEGLMLKLQYFTHMVDGTLELPLQSTIFMNGHPRIIPTTFRPHMLVDIPHNHPFPILIF